MTNANETTCCIVGAGPSGAILSLLLARQGIPVTLLEAQEDFDRDFRGDTIHPNVLHLMDQLGLVERLLELRHSKLRKVSFQTPDGPFIAADLGRVEKKFPFIMMVPQANFLEFITNEAKKYPHFQLLMGASAQELIEDNGTVRGVRYRSERELSETHALLTVGADGRSSRIRKLGGFELIKTSPLMDILWFRIPRDSKDPEGVLGRFGRGHGLVMLDRLTEWQVGFIILKGSYSEIRAAGIDALRGSIAEMAPEFGERIKHLQDWKQVTVLSVESSRVSRWYKPGLLMTGDAAHVMSPVGGVGINYAIQDAVVAANVLSESLKAGQVTTEDLQEVQRQREFPTKVIQWIQSQAQKRILGAALRSDRPLRIPSLVRMLLRTPIIRDLPARVIAHGVKRVEIDPKILSG